MPPHILHVFPSFGIGGMPLRTVRLMNHLGTRCRHTVISLDGIIAAADQIRADVLVEILPMVIDKRQPIRNLVNARRFLADVKPDLLATYNWGAIEWAAVNRLHPVCRHIHFEAGFGREEAIRQFRRRIIGRRVALAKSDFVMVPSRSLQCIALEIWRLPAHRVRYIPDGIDVARFTATRQFVSDAREGREHVVLGTVAPLRPEKNIGRLIKLFSLLADDPRFELVIAGDGPERMRLQGVAAQVSNRIRFLGHVPRPEEVLPTFDIFCLTSDTEQIPNSVLEAMSAALPIVSVDVGDIGLMVAPSNQPYVVERDRIEKFASALRELADDPDLRYRIGSENRIQVEAHFEQERMFQEYEQLLLGNVAKRPRTPG